MLALKLHLEQNLTKMVKISINTLLTEKFLRYSSLVQDNLIDNPSASGFRGKPG